MEKPENVPGLVEVFNVVAVRFAAREGDVGAERMKTVTGSRAGGKRKLVIETFAFSSSESFVS